MLNYTFTKSDMGRKLVCLVEHVAYPTGSQNSSVALDVLCKYPFVMFSASDRLGLFDTFLADKPSVKIVRVDGGSVLEDGISTLSLSCISESNPPAQVRKFSKETTHLTISNQVMWSRKGPGVDSTPQYTEVSAFISSSWKPHSLPPWIHQHLLSGSRVQAHNTWASWSLPLQR